MVCAPSQAAVSAAPQLSAFPAFFPSIEKLLKLTIQPICRERFSQGSHAAPVSAACRLCADYSRWTRGRGARKGTSSKEGFPQQVQIQSLNAAEFAAYE